MVVPPKMFECVTENVYRSNLVTAENIPFLQSIQLKTVVILGKVELDENVTCYFNSFDINIVDLHIDSELQIYICDSEDNRQCDWKPIGDDSVKYALELILNKDNHPILIMCSYFIYHQYYNIEME